MIESFRYMGQRMIAVLRGWISLDVLLFHSSAIAIVYASILTAALLQQYSTQSEVIDEENLLQWRT